MRNFGFNFQQCVSLICDLVLKHNRKQSDVNVRNIRREGMGTRQRSEKSGKEMEYGENLKRGSGTHRERMRSNPIIAPPRYSDTHHHVYPIPSHHSFLFLLPARPSFHPLSFQQFSLLFSQQSKLQPTFAILYIKKKKKPKYAIFSCIIHVTILSRIILAI